MSVSTVLQDDKRVHSPKKKTSVNPAPQDDKRTAPRVDVASLASFTHHYAPAPSDYDDSKAGGGRTYFFQPLPFRRTTNRHVPRLTTRSWMDSESDRRPRRCPSLFVYIKKYQSPIYRFNKFFRLPTPLRGTIYDGSYLVRRPGFTGPVAIHVPLPGSAYSTASEISYTSSEWESQASPKPPEGYVGSAVSEYEPALNSVGVPLDWEGECTTEDLDTTVVVACSEPCQSEKQQTLDEVSSAVEATVVEDASANVNGTVETIKKDDTDAHESALSVELHKSPAASITPEKTFIDKLRQFLHLCRTKIPVWQVLDKLRLCTKILLWLLYIVIVSMCFIVAAILGGIVFILAMVVGMFVTWMLLCTAVGVALTLFDLAEYPVYLLVCLALNCKETIMYYILFSIIMPIDLPEIIHSLSSS